MQTWQSPNLHDTSGPIRTLAWLYAPLVLPSLYIVEKFIGTGGMWAYAFLTALLLAAVPSLPVPVPRTRRAELLLAIALFAVVVAIFVSAYPVANVHLPLRGSDDDDAYNVGARALLAFRSPYGERTYLGNVLHQLPGAFILAMPFVLLGTSALQNLFWLPLFFAAGRHDARDGRWAVLAITVLASSPIVAYQVATGTGHIANTVYVLLGLWWLMRTGHRDVAALAWGVALASRANFLFLVPLAAGWIRHRAGWRVAIRAGLLAVLPVIALSVPFYVADPSGFGPLEAANRLSRFNTVLPHADAIIVALTAVVSVLLALPDMSARQLFLSCALVQALPVASATVLGLVWFGGVDLVFLEYSTFAAWFVFMAWMQGDRPGGLAPERQAVRQDRR